MDEFSGRYKYLKNLNRPISADRRRKGAPCAQTEGINRPPAGVRFLNNMSIKTYKELKALKLITREKSH